ncbi:MAG: acireductone synthase [Planctomycetota bacterium]
MVKKILLDIEGTTSSISFVHDEMFPYVLTRLDTFLADRIQAPAVVNACDLIAVDAGFASLEDWTARESQSATELVADNVRALMAKDAKATGLKALQGVMWKDGFDSGELKAHSFPEVIPCIRKWNQAGVDVRIYSSGSIAAQKLFFGHLDEHGDCLDLFTGHYDTTIGGKKETASYEAIIQDWGGAADEILFVSDIVDELEAASAAGLQVRLSVRPGNHPVPESARFDRIESFEEILIA